jgi:hypothetical protein
MVLKYSNALGVLKRRYKTMNGLILIGIGIVFGVFILILVTLKVPKE